MHIDYGHSLELSNELSKAPPLDVALGLPYIMPRCWAVPKAEPALQPCEAMCTEALGASMRLRARHARTLVAPVAAFVGAGLCAGRPPLQVEHLRQSCTATLASLTTPLLADGHRIYVEPTTIGYAAGRLLILGGPVLLDEGQTVTRASPNGRPAAGILLDSTGRATVVPAPAPDSSLVGARIVSTADGEWSVIWNRVAPPMSRSLAAATLTQSTFDGERWSAPVEITHFEQALLDPALSSVAAPTASGFALALPVRQVTADGSVSVLSRQNGTWRRSDVPLTRNAIYTSLVSSGGRWIIAYVGSDSLTTGIFAASSDDRGGTWSRPTRTAVEHGYSVQLLSVQDGLALLLLGEGRPLQPRGLTIMFSRDGLTWGAPHRVTGSDSTAAFSAVPRSSTAAVVLRQDGGARRRVQSIGIVGGQSVRWLRSDTVDAITKPLITRGVADDFYAAWAAVDASAGSPKPKLRVARYRVSCDGAE